MSKQEKVQKNIDKTLQAVIGKSWEDDSFRKQLVANPHAAIKSAAGVTIPADMNIVFTDQTDENTVYVNIPPKPDMDNMELTDEQLEQVAGGEVVFMTIMGVGITVTGASTAVGATATTIGVAGAATSWSW